MSADVLDLREELKQAESKIQRLIAEKESLTERLKVRRLLGIHTVSYQYTEQNESSPHT